MPTDEENDRQAREMREVLGTTLVPGVNFTTWPNLKWERAKAHLATLRASFEVWQASAPVTIEGVLRDDEQTIDLVMRVPRGVPNHEWSLILGDAIHNLRSAFDAVAWGMATHNGAVPRLPRQVAFPVAEADDPKVWERAMKNWLGAIDPGHRGRIEIMQPYTFAPAGSETFLSVLAELDNLDKHRNLIKLSAELQQVDLGSVFSVVDPHSTAVPDVVFHEFTELRDGEIVATIHAGTTVMRPVIIRLVPTCQMVMTHGESGYEVTEFANALLVETRRCLDMLIRGLALDDEAEPENAAS